MISGENQPIIVQEPYKEEGSKEKLSAIHLERDNVNKQQQKKPETWQLQKQGKEQKGLSRVGKGIELNDESFFKVMDLVDGYDRLLKEMSEQYSGGMLLIASVKFTNPYTSLSTKGYKPTPAITKLSPFPPHQQNPLNQLKQLFTLTQQTKSIKFTNSVIDSINREIQLDNNLNEINESENQNEEEIESQSAHSSMSTAHQIYSLQEEECIMEEQECVDECRRIVELDEGKFNLQEFIIERFSISTQKQLVTEASVKFTSLLKKLLFLASYRMHILGQFDKIQNSLQPK